MNTDLPTGYRWMTARECDRYAAWPEAFPDAIIVKRTTDSSGEPYTQDEADIALPLQRNSGA